MLAEENYHFESLIKNCIRGECENGYIKRTADMVDEKVLHTELLTSKVRISYNCSRILG